MWLFLLMLACGDTDADSGGATADGGTADGGAADGGPTDGGADGGGADGGSTSDGGSDGGDEVLDCTTLTWHEGDLAFDSATGIAGFCETHNAVKGSLFVDVGQEVDPITELDGIKCLCEVTGDLTITGDSALTPPELPGLVGALPPHVTGDIELSILERIGGDLVLTHHPSLTYVEGLRGLLEVGGDIVISGNPEMQVASFYALETLGGTVHITDMDKQLILRLPTATSIGGLELGASGDGQTLSLLVEVKLDDLQTVTGDLRLFGPRNLAVLQAPSLTTVGGTLQLEGSCITQPSFPLLESVGALRLVGNCGLLDLDGFGALTTITAEDTDGTSLEIGGSDHLDDDELAAFLAQLSSTGTGTAETAGDGSCAETVATYGEGYCD